MTPRRPSSAASSDGNLTKDVLDKARSNIAKQAAAHKLPRDLEGQVRKLLAERPELSWDMAETLVLGLG